MDDRRIPAPEAVTLVYIDVEAPHADARTADDVLAWAVRHLRGELRQGDAVGRYGAGVLALLQGTHADGGEQIVDRLLEALSTSTFASPRGELRVRASANLAHLEAGERLDEAARRAQPV